MAHDSEQAKQLWEVLGEPGAGHTFAQGLGQVRELMRIAGQGPADGSVRDLRRLLDRSEQYGMSVAGRLAEVEAELEERLNERAVTGLDGLGHRSVGEWNLPPTMSPPPSQPWGSEPVSLALDSGRIDALEQRVVALEARATVGARSVAETQADKAQADGSDLMADPERDECWPLPEGYRWARGRDRDVKTYDVIGYHIVVVSAAAGGLDIDRDAPDRVTTLALCRNGYLPRPAALAAWRVLGGAA